jgi:hypothetical protein
MYGIPNTGYEERRFKMDYSGLNDSAKEDIAERVAMAVLKLDDLAYVIQPEVALNRLLQVRQELIQLVKDLGGHPAIQ